MQMRLLRGTRASLPLLLTAALGFGCSSSGANAGDGITELQSSVTRMTPDVTEATAASSDEQAFAWSFFQQLDGTSNHVFSPYSISLATAMLSAAASGETLAQIQQALHYSTSGTTFHAGQDALELALEALNKPASNASSNDPVVLQLSDDVWVRRGYAPSSDYLDTLAEYYGAGVHQFDDANAALRAVNDKVSQDTNGLIPMLLASLDPNTQLMLTNVLYFKASWSTAWQDRSEVQFHRLDDSVSSATMIAPPNAAYLGYAEGDGYRALSVPYSNTSLELLLILPDDGNFAALRPQLDAAFVSNVVASEQARQTALVMPKLDVDDDMGTALVDHLKALGMTDLFGTAPELPGFGAAASVTAAHHAHLILDENGTSAAAATFYGAATDAAVDAVEFTVDHPFYFAIRDAQTNAVLFIGQIVDPG